MDRTRRTRAPAGFCGSLANGLLESGRVPRGSIRTFTTSRLQDLSSSSCLHCLAQQGRFLRLPENGAHTDRSIGTRLKSESRGCNDLWQAYSSTQAAGAGERQLSAVPRCGCHQGARTAQGLPDLQRQRQAATLDKRGARNVRGGREPGSGRVRAPNARYLTVSRISCPQSLWAWRTAACLTSAASGR